MSHLSEEQLILHYYGEAGDGVSVESHLDQCEACRAVYSSLQRVLNVMETLPVPERSPEYGKQVWQRLGPYLPYRPRLRFLLSPWRWAAAGAAVAALLIAAFAIGRFYPQAPPRIAVTITADPQTQERVLRLAVGDYLDRSQIVLTELANASAARDLDISSEQERAANLLTENRLYRQTAAHTGDAVVAGVLEDLERVLLEIEHAPSRLAPAQLDELRRRLRSEGILFRMRVLDSTVQDQDENKL
ncbi:MAG: hypothetical protein C5B51_00555 [Terriglobia bacterium]|nr:MAG: hypothetical protein C5B51_00555 [Terriglobia bacterium]